MGLAQRSRGIAYGLGATQSSDAWLRPSCLKGTPWLDPAVIPRAAAGSLAGSRMLSSCVGAILAWAHHFVTADHPSTAHRSPAVGPASSLPDTHTLRTALDSAFLFPGGLLHRFAQPVAVKSFNRSQVISPLPPDGDWAWSSRCRRRLAWSALNTLGLGLVG